MKKLSERSDSPAMCLQISARQLEPGYPQCKEQQASQFAHVQPPPDFKTYPPHHYAAGVCRHDHASPSSANTAHQRHLFIPHPSKSSAPSLFHRIHPSASAPAPLNVVRNSAVGVELGNAAVAATAAVPSAAQQ